MHCNRILSTMARHGRRSVRPIVYLLIAALAVLGTVGVMADEAAPAPPPGPSRIAPIKGTVTAVTGSALSVQQADGTTTTVNVNDQTRYMATVASAVSNIKVGDMVAVKGDKTGDNAYHATGLTIMGAPVMIQSGPDGKALSGGGIQIGPDGKAFSGDRAITGTPPPLPAGATCTSQNASANATYVDNTPGTPPAGEITVAISGTPPSGAEKPVFGCITHGKFADGTRPVLGKVTNVSGSTITLQAPDSTTVTVTTDAQTVVHADQQSSLSAIKAGDTVMVGGVKANDGAVTALFVHDGALDI